MSDMNITEILERAMKETTFVDALSVACIWECERAIAQARKNEFDAWETCFRHVIELVVEKWETGDLQTAHEHIAELYDLNNRLKDKMQKMRNRADDC